MSLTNKQWLGLPLNLVWGYIAIAIFMTGDGFELAFLSHYIKALGFTPAEASFAFTLYRPGGSAFRLGFRRSCRNYYATKNHVYRLCAVVRISRAVSGLWSGAGELWVNPAVLWYSWPSLSAVPLRLYCGDCP